MLRFIDWPAVQTVPAATLWTTDQEPEAHCWKLVPPMQLNMPSEVQGPVCAPAVLVVPVDAGVEAEVVAAGVGTGTALGEIPGEVEFPDTMGAGATAVGEAAEPVVAKTPPGRLAAADDETTVASVVGEAVVAGLAPEAAAELLPPVFPPEVPAPVVPPPTPFTAAQVPVTEPELSVRPAGRLVTTSGPGSGKTTSLPSTEVQPLARLATKSPGRAEKATEGDARLLEPPAMVTLAQFM